MFSTSFYRASIFALFLLIASGTAHAQNGLADDPQLLEEMSSVEIVDYLLSNEYVWRILFSMRPSEQDWGTLINLVVTSGQEGFEFLLQEAEIASREDLIRYTVLISKYRYAEDIDTNVLIDFIDRKGRDASTYDDVADFYPLIANLGFFPERNGMVEAFLMGMAADTEAFTANWPVMRHTGVIDEVDLGIRDGVFQELRSVAITALFHKQTTSALNFLEELRRNAPEGSFLRFSLDFHFDILEEFSSLEDYLNYTNERRGIID